MIPLMPSTTNDGSRPVCMLGIGNDNIPGFGRVSCPTGMTLWSTAPPAIVLANPATHLAFRCATLDLVNRFTSFIENGLCAVPERPAAASCQVCWFLRHWDLTGLFYNPNGTPPASDRAEGFPSNGPVPRPDLVPLVREVLADRTSDRSSRVRRNPRGGSSSRRRRGGPGHNDHDGLR